MTKKQQIFEAAAVLFREKGYATASMRDLAERVGLKPSSFYSHIKSKEELLQKICFESADKFTQGMAAVLADGGTSMDQLRALISLHLRVALEDPTSVTVFNEEWRHLSEPHLTEFLNLRREYENNFLEIIKTGIKQGLLKPLDPGLVLYTMINALRWLYFDSKLTKERNVRDIEKDLSQLLLDGLKA